MSKYILKDGLFKCFLFIKHDLLKIFNISIVCMPYPCSLKIKIYYFLLLGRANSKAVEYIL